MLAELHAWALSILRDEHDAGFLKSPLQRFNSALFQFFSPLKSSNGIDLHLGCCR
jgi:hypothetical protein